MLAPAVAMWSCKDDDQALKWVDLRYKVEDSYTVTAVNAEPVSFQVKSTDPWTVKGTAGWYTITPSEGNPGDIFDVVLQCHDNADLDDRSDVIVIKSDYWVGKEFTVTQKGTAYMTLDYDTGFRFTKDGGNFTIGVESNQNWSAAVTVGADWLSVTSGATGSLDGSVTVHAEVNRGESHTATVTFYDRHGVKAHDVLIAQNGLELIPEQLVYKRLHQDQSFDIPVQANSAWKIEKEDPNDSWISFSPETFTNDGSLQTYTVTVHLDENVSLATRPAALIFSTPDDDPDVIPVVRRVVIKQANEPKLVRKVFNSAELGNWTVSGGVSASESGAAISSGASISKTDAPAGIYSFHTAPVASTAVISKVVFNYRHLFADGGSVNHEIQYGFNDTSTGAGKTQVFITPWAMSGASFAKNVAYDQPHVRTLKLQPMETNPNYMRLEWQLDGTEICVYYADGVARTYPPNIPQSGAFVLPGDASGKLSLHSTGGVTTYSWYEFTPNIDWGD